MSIMGIVSCLYSTIVAKCKHILNSDRPNIDTSCIPFSSLTIDGMREIAATGIDLNRKNKYDRTFLMSLAKYNTNPALIEAALDLGADIDDSDHEGTTALMMAAMDNSNHQVVEALINVGAKVNQQNVRKRTALMLAAKYNTNPEIVEILLKNGADGTIRDCRGFTAFEHLKKSYNVDLRQTKAFRLLKQSARSEYYPPHDESETDLVLD